MRAKKVDANQSSIVKQLRQIPGVSVAHIHTVGQGVPDILVGVTLNNPRFGKLSSNYLIELKDPSQPPSKRKLTEDEQRFHKEWTGQIAICETLEDVLKVIGVS